MNIADTPAGLVVGVEARARRLIEAGHHPTDRNKQGKELRKMLACLGRAYDELDLPRPELMADDRLQARIEHRLLEVDGPPATKEG